MDPTDKRTEIFFLSIIIITIACSGYNLYKDLNQPEPQQYIVVWENSTTGKTVLMEPLSKKHADKFVEIGNKWNPGVVRAWKFPYYPDRAFQYGREDKIHVW